MHSPNLPSVPRSLLITLYCCGYFSLTMGGGGGINVIMALMMMMEGRRERGREGKVRASAAAERTAN